MQLLRHLRWDGGFKFALLEAKLGHVSQFLSSKLAKSKKYVNFILCYYFFSF